MVELIILIIIALITGIFFLIIAKYYKEKFIDNTVVITNDYRIFFKELIECLIESSIFAFQTNNWSIGSSKLNKLYNLLKKLHSHNALDEELKKYTKDRMAEFNHIPGIFNVKGGNNQTILDKINKLINE